MDIESDPGRLEISLPFPAAGWGRVLYGLFVTILPVFSFWIIHVMKPDWQSGKLSDYAILFLFPEASFFVLPLLAYSILCFLLLLIDSSRFAKVFLIRFGVYTGVVLALHYSIAVLLSLEFSPSLFLLVVAWIFPLIFSRVYPWAVKNWNMKLLGVLFASTAAVLSLISMFITRNIFSPFFTALILLVLVAPFWSFLLSMQAAIWLIKRQESRITFLRALGIGTWVAGYVGALRFNVLKMYELYAALPPQPPDCYIATVAAKGHTRFVGSRLVELENGRPLRINKQLQRLKCFELVMMTAFPRLHVFFRKVYDIAGKSLAAKIQNPYAADIAYLLLVPVEWTSFLILKIFIPEIQDISKKIYHS